MEMYELIGYCAGALTTFAVVPQIRKAVKTREANDISVIMVVTLICGLSLWTLYGVLTGAWPIVVTNGLAVVLNCFLLGVVFYDRRQR